jgi:hypothetical protein
MSRNLRLGKTWSRNAKRAMRTRPRVHGYEAAEMMTTGGLVVDAVAVDEGVYSHVVRMCLTF